MTADSVFVSDDLVIGAGSSSVTNCYGSGRRSERGRFLQGKLETKPQPKQAGNCHYSD